MWKKVRCAGVAVFFVLAVVAAGLWWVPADKTPEWTQRIERAERREMASAVWGCVYATDSDLLRFLHNPTQLALVRTILREDRCEKLLDVVGSRTQDEEIGLIFGEVKLFLNGYRQTMVELIDNRLKAKKGSLSEEEFREVQTRLLQEAHKIIYRIEDLLLLGTQ